MQSGEYKLTGFDLTTHFDEDLIDIAKFNPSIIISAVYLEGSFNYYYLKRFVVEETDKKTLFISESQGSKLITFSAEKRPVLKIVFDDEWNGKHIESEKIIAEEFIGVKSFKAKGKRLSTWEIKEISWLESLPAEPDDNEPNDISEDDANEPVLFDPDEPDDIQANSTEDFDIENAIAEDENDGDEPAVENPDESSFPADEEPSGENLPEENEPGPDSIKKTVTRKPRRKDDDEAQAQMSLF